jgi:hypothetical protein
MQAQRPFQVPPCCPKACRRGSAILTRILIAGYGTPLIVQDGKRIENWTSGVREQLIWRACKLRQELISCTSRWQSVLPNQAPHTPASTSLCQPFESPQIDLQMQKAGTDIVEFVECDRDTGFQFWEDPTIQ